MALIWCANLARAYCQLRTSPLASPLLRPPAAQKYWTIECDSSLCRGGAHSPTHFTIRYPCTLVEKDLNITQLEALNLVAAHKSLAPPEPHLHVIIINTDNTVSQQPLTSGSGRDPLVCACVRESGCLQPLTARIFMWNISQGAKYPLRMPLAGCSFIQQLVNSHMPA